MISAPKTSRISISGMSPDVLFSFVITAEASIYFVAVKRSSFRCQPVGEEKCRAGVGQSFPLPLWGQMS